MSVFDDFNMSAETKVLSTEIDTINTALSSLGCIVILLVIGFVALGFGTALKFNKLLQRIEALEQLEKTK